MSPPKLLVSKSATMTQQQLSAANTSKEDSLERKILAMSSLDLAVAIQSMNSIDNVRIYILNCTYIFHIYNSLLFCS